MLIRGEVRRHAKSTFNSSMMAGTSASFQALDPVHAGFAGKASAGTLHPSRSLSAMRSKGESRLNPRLAGWNADRYNQRPLPTD